MFLLLCSRFINCHNSTKILPERILSGHRPQEAPIGFGFSDNDRPNSSFYRASTQQCWQSVIFIMVWMVIMIQSDSVCPSIRLLHFGIISNGLTYHHTFFSM